MRSIRPHGAWIVAAAALLGVTPVLVAATSGGATTKRVALACGQTVTTSVTLTADLTGCAGRGLVIGANGITVNLNGHTISGTGSLEGIFDPSFSSVKVINGSITNFNYGVQFWGGSGATAQGLRVFKNANTGIQTNVPSLITGNVVYDNGKGIYVGCCAPDKSTVTNNVSNSNGTDGIYVSSSAAGSTVSGNRALSNFAYGIWVEADNVTVSGNTANANGDGLAFASTESGVPSKLTGNKAFFNTKLGIDPGPGDTDGGGNKAGGNGSQHQCENIVCS